MRSVFLKIFFLSVLGSSLIGSQALAEIQVPESCVDRIYPCLVKADEGDYKFLQGGYEALLTSKSIVKITKEKTNINFEILKGSLSLKELKAVGNSVSVNSVLLGSSYVMAKRDFDHLKIFSLSNFTESHYAIKIKEGSIPEHVKTNFLSKSELVDFTKVYFSNVKKFKNFLVLIEESWKHEFQKQNETQTKVLMRSIASVENETEDHDNKKIKEAEEIKKARTELFFRTFER